VDGDGNIILADNFNHRIRKITPQGHVSTLAGTGKEGDRDGEGTIAQFKCSCEVAVDGDGNIIVADCYNDRIRKITPQGHVSTLAGTGQQGYGDLEGIVAQFNGPCGIAVDGDGNIIVVDNINCCIRKITPQSHVSTLAGTGEEGQQDREGTVAQFFQPCGLAMDRDGNVVVADAENHHIRKITPQGHVSTLAGKGDSWGHEDGEGKFAVFNGPSGVAVDENGNVIVADKDNHCIRRAASDGASCNPATAAPFAACV
jgi:DNA-binding beta-propeller fold protein YncE